MTIYNAQDTSGLLYRDFHRGNSCPKVMRYLSMSIGLSRLLLISLPLLSCYSTVRVVLFFLHFSPQSLSTFTQLSQNLIMNIFIFCNYFSSSALQVHFHFCFISSIRTSQEPRQLACNAPNNKLQAKRQRCEMREEDDTDHTEHELHFGRV
jgi:hypothetical protein